MKELHRIRIRIHVSKVNINIKFPCSIKVQLKLDPERQSTSNVYPLKNGECQIDEKLQLQLQSIYDTERMSYNQTQLSLIAIIVSTNSNFPAGNIFFNPFLIQQGEQRETQQLLQKCSDRQARITFTYSYHFINKIKDIQQQIKTYKNTNRSYTKNVSYRGYEHHQNRQKEISGSLQKSQINEFITESRVRAFGDGLPPRYAKQKVKTYTNQTNQRRQNALKSEVELLTLQVDKYRQKCRNMQRKQRQLNMIIKDLKDNVEKKKMKFMQSQSSKSTVEIVLNQKEKLIKQLKMQMKKLSQKIQDLKLQNNRLEKKIDIKQRSYDDELKMYSQKVSQLQKQISKKTYESNELLQKMEISEKNYQLSNKDKQKQFNEQKTRLLKKIDQLNQQIQRLNEVNEDKESKILNMTSQIKSMSQDNINKANNIQKLESNLDLVKTELKTEKENRQAFQKQIEGLSAAESDKNIFKKRYNETLQILNKLNEKHERSVLNQNQLQLKLSQFEEKNKQMNKTNKQLNQQVNNLINDLQNLKKDNTNLSNQYNALSAKHLNLTQKLNDMKSKFDAQKQEFEQMQAHYEDKLNYWAKSKQYVQHEAEDWKQKFQKLQLISNDLENKCRMINDQLLMRHKQTIQLEQLNKKHQQRIEQIQNKNSRLTIQIQGWQKKEKQLQESVKLKGNDVYDLQRKLTNQEQEIYLLTEKVQNLTKSQSELHSLFEKTVEQKDKLISHKINDYEELRNQHISLEQSYENLVMQMNNKKKDLMLQEDQIKQYEEIMEGDKKRIIELELNITQNKTRILGLEEELADIKHAQEEAIQTNRSLDTNWVVYREGTKKALQQLIDQMSQDSCTIDVQLYKFEDSSLQAMQMSALNSRNQIISKYRTKIFGLEENIDFYKREIEKIKNLHKEKQTELDKQIESLQNKASDMYHKYMQEKQQFSVQLAKAQEQKQQLISQIEKQKSTVLKLEEIIEELNENKLLLQNQLDNRQNQITLLEQQILDMKSSSIQEKTNIQGNFKDYKEYTQQQIQSLKRSLIEMSQKLLNVQREKQQKESKISQLISEIDNLKLQGQKQSTRKSQFEQKLKQFQRQSKQLKLTVSNKQKIISDLNDLSNSLRGEVKSCQDKISVLENERREIYEQLTQTTVKKQQLTTQCMAAEERISKLMVQLVELQGMSMSNSETLTIEIKQMKDKVTKLQSQVELKVYVISQLQKIKQSNQSEIKQLSRQLESRKQLLVTSNREIQNLKNVILKLQENKNNNGIQLESIREENSSNIEKIIELQNVINELSPKAEQLQVRVEEMQVLKRTIIELENDNHRVTLELKSTQNQYKNLNNKLFSKEQDYRKRIQSLQTTIQQKQINSLQQSQKLHSDWQREKSLLMKELQDQDKLLREQQQQSKFRIQQLQQQINTLNADCLELSHLLQEKQEEIIHIEQQYEESERKISQLNNQLKSCLQAWDKEKLSYMPSRKQISDLQLEMGKFQDYASELDGKTKQLIEISKRKSVEDSKLGISDVIKDLSSSILKSKNKILTKIQSEQQKQSIMNEYKILQDKLDGVIKTQNIFIK